MARTPLKQEDIFAETTPYQFMPFPFGRMPNHRVLLTNQSGEFIFLSEPEFADFIAQRLPPRSNKYYDLKARHFLTQGPDSATLRVAASQWRTKKAFLEGGPKLHIFVPTLRCNQSCGYCQASRVDADSCGADMTPETAARAIDLMLESPSPKITMEFQGGEPLLAFDLLRFMVDTTLEKAKGRKSVSFVICSNLTLLNDEHLAFLKQHDFAVSTSLDGPARVHDKNRPLTGAASHSLVARSIRRCQAELGDDRVSALMTTTVHSLGNAKDIVDEYIALHQCSIFLRELNPYGFAAKSSKAIGYELEGFIAFYTEALSYILDINRQVTFFSEGYATTLLRKILTPFGVGFVDLQSPTGEGFGVVLYNHDGGVYASDEARMLAEMGDHSFRLGHVDDGYLTVFLSKTMKEIAAAGCAESLPGCSECAYLPYCGADPIRHYRTQADLIGHRPTSGFCKKQRAIFDILFRLLADSDPETMRIFMSWMFPGRTKMPRPSWLS